jgi:hypothetical protein
MPSYAIQTSQIQCFWRSQHRGPRKAAVTNRLLQQALRQQANYTTNPQAATPLQHNPASPAYGSLWAHTIAKIYADSGLAICKPPTGQSTGPPSSITSCPPLAHSADQLHQHANTTLGDLHNGQQWILPNHFPAALRAHLQPLFHRPPQPAPDHLIHPGQFWHLSPAIHQQPARTIYEILPDPGPQGRICARPRLPMNPHSHLNPVPGDTHC